MPPTDSTSLTPPLSPPKRPFPGSTSSRADSSRPAGSSLVPHHGWLGRTSPAPAPEGQQEEEEEEEEEPQMKSPMSDSALLTTPRNSLRTADQAEGRSQSLTLSSKKRSAFRRRLQPQWDTLRLGRHSAPGKSQTSSACSRVSAGGDENRDPIVHGKRSKSPSGRATTPRRNLFGERSAITGQAIPALGTKESVGASASTFYGAESQMTPVLVSSPRALKSALKNGREAVGRTRGLLGDDLAHHPGVRAKRVRSRPVPIEEVGDGGVPPMIPLTDFALPIDSSMKPAVFVDPHRVGLPNIGMTCYMNSVLQCLFSLPPFKQSLKSIRESVSSAVQNEPELLDNVSILRAITDLMTDREKGQMSHIDEKVRYLQAEFQKIRQEFQLGCQQDAHEFLTQLFDAIEFQSMTLMANDSSVQCPVSENFEYNVSVVKTCSQCDTKLHSTLKDTMWKLNSPRSNTKNLTSLIQNSLTSTVKANCPQCEAKAKANGTTYEGTLAHQVYEFETLPRVFMLHLPRMHYYKNHSGDYACDKREIPIEIPPVLNMEELAVPSDQMFKRLQNYTDIEESFDEHKNYHVELELLDPEITFKRPSNPVNYAVNSRISSQNGEALDYSRKSFDVKNISPVKPPNRGGPGSLSPLTELECSALYSNDENGNVQSTARNPSSRSGLQQGLTEAATAMLGLGSDLGWIREKQPSPDSVQEVPNSCVVRQDSPDDSREDDTSLGESHMDIDEELRSNGIHITEDLFEQEENASDGVALNKQLCVEVDEPRSHVEGGGGRLVLTFDHKEHDTSDLSRTESAASDFSHSSFSSKGDELDDVSASVSDEDTKIIRTFNNKVDNPYFNYYLVAMVNHIGESVNSGHYKADVYSLARMLAETRSLEERIQIPGSRVHLVYRSSSAPGAHATLDIQLTPEQIPESLIRVFLVIRISGRVFRQTFEADPDLTFTYAWDKRNVYNQKVYGVVGAKVSVGYFYQKCQYPIWTSQTTRLRGFDVDISDIAKGWNLDTHHHYNSEQGLFQKGDGHWIEFKSFPRVVSTTMGTGLKRTAVNCGSDCDGLAKKLDLLNIVSMTTSPDGSIYVGDFNLIRKIGTDGTVQTILQFGASQGSYHYDLKISPLDGRLYITHAERRQILRILDESDSPEDNLEVVVGNGLRCIPGDEDDCGDNGPALNARLNYPKGVAIAMDGTMYISDSRNIRVVMPNGNINTLIGHNGPQSGPPRPLACRLAFLVQDVQLQWPTKLELNPLDNSLHIVDDTMVLRLTTDMRVEVIAGLSPSCNNDLNQTKVEPDRALALSAPANRRIFGPLIDLAFGPCGQLFLAEKQPNPQRNVIHIIDFHGQVRAFAGQSSPPASEAKNVSNSQDITLTSVLADQISFNQLSAIALSPDNTLHVADNGASKIYSLKESQPLVNATSGNVLISDPIAREIYTFNRYGQHVSTHSLETGAKLLSFIYSKNTAFGRLTVMLDALGNKISLQRDYTNRVQSIENTHGQKHALRLSRMGYLEVFNQDERNAISLSYEENSGLVVSKTHTNGDFFVYEFDSSGRLGRVVLPSGESFQMTSRICPQATTSSLAASCVEIQRNHRTQMRIATHQSGMVQILNPNEDPFPAFSHEDDREAASTPTCQPLSIFNLPHFTSEMTSSTCLGQQPIRLSLGPSSPDIGPPTLLQIDPFLHDLQQRSALQQNLVLFDSKYPHWNPLRLNWKFNQRESGSPTNRMTTWYSLEHGKSMEDISKALMIDGHEQILGVHYDPKTQEETFLNGHGQVLMTVEYINGVLPKGWSDQQGHNCTWNYDRIHRPSQLNCDGRQIESKAYDQRNGRISQSQTCQQRAAKKFNYGTNANMPRDVILPSGRIFSYEYDQMGGLSRITLPTVAPQGQSDTSPPVESPSHSFALQFGFGHVKLYHQPPGSMEPLVVYWHESDGKIMKIRPPGNNGLRLFQYSPDGRLRAVISGQEQTTFEYGPKAYASKIEHRVDDGDFSMSETELEEIRVKELEVGQRHQQQRVVLQEKRIVFGAETALAGGKFEYEYGLNWNEPIIQGRIGAQALPEMFVWHIWGLSAKHSRRQIGQFFLQMHHLNETSITDAVASFRRTSTSESLVVNGKQVYSADLTFDPCHPAKVASASIRLQRETGEFNRILGFVYDDDGQLFKVSDANGFRDNWEWQYVYDPLGNLASISASTSSSMVKHSLFYDDFNRIARLDGSFYRYDDVGRIATNQNGHALLFNARNLLIKAETIKGVQVTLNYDYKGRLVSRSDNLGNVTQYFYAHREKDHLITHAYRPREGVLSSLLYDNQDRLIFAQVGQKSLYIVSDWNGSPFLYVSPTGQIVREIRRSPYGQIISETTSGWDEDPDQDHIYSALLPLGFRGGLVDPELGLVHMQDPSGSRPYDPETGTFLTPMAWNEILNRQSIFDPTHWQSLYRFPGNDPINSRSNSIRTDPKEALNFIQSHLHNAFPTLDEDNINRLIHSKASEKPNQSSQPFQHLSWPTFSLAIGAEQQFRTVHASFHRLWAVRPSPLISQPEMEDLDLKITRAGSALGKFVVLSREGRDRVRINMCPKKANEVTADVFATVLNDATLVDFTMVSHAGEDSYFFVKNPIWKSSEDIVQLRRLGPKEVNLTMHESQTDNSKILDVKVHLSKTVINVRYGTLAEVEKMRLLRHSLKTMTRRAWIHERDSLSKQSSNFPPFVSGHKPWSDRERSQILNKGFAEGYDVAYKRDVRQYPELANDLENVQFVRKA